MSLAICRYEPQQTTYISAKIPPDQKDLSKILRDTLETNPTTRYIDPETKVKYYRAGWLTVCQVFPKDSTISYLEGALKTLRKAILFTYDPLTDAFEENKDVLAIKPKTTRPKDDSILTELLPVRMQKQIDLFEKLANSRGIARVLKTFTYQSIHHQQKKSVLIMPLYKNGDLFSHTRVKLGSPHCPLFLQEHPDRKICIHNILLDLFHGICAIHANGFIHRDLKTENILLDSDWRAAITDFDLCVNVREMNPLIEGTLECLAPEYRKITWPTAKQVKAATTQALDLWGAGIILYTMFASDPSHGLPTDLYCESIENPSRGETINLRHPFFTKKPDDLSPYGHLTWNLLQIDPQKRPTAAAVLKWLESMQPVDTEHRHLL